MVQAPDTHALQSAVGDPVRWAFLTAAQLLHASRASLLLRQGTEPVLTVAASVGMEAAVAASVRQEVGNGIAGLAVERGLMLCGDAAGAAFLTVPIVTSRGVAGVLNLTDRAGGGHFGEDEIAFARLVASHIAYLLERTMANPFGLSDRGVFLETLERELSRSRRMRHPLVLGLLSLDFASLGPNRSDPATVMHELAEALRAHIRRYDSVALFAEGAFAFLFPELEEVDEQLAARLVQTVREATSTIDLKVPIRVGLARCPHDAVTADELLATAEKRLSESGGAKRLARP